VSAINEITSKQTDYLQATSPTLVDSFTMDQLQQPSDGALAINFDIDSSQRATTIELLNGGTVVKSATIGSVTLPVGRFLSQRWRQQPQRPVEIDWNNPITRSLIACVSPSNPLREITQGRALSWLGLSQGFDVTASGRAFARASNGTTGQVASFGDVQGPTLLNIASAGGAFTAAIVSGGVPQSISNFGSTYSLASIALYQYDTTNLVQEGSYFQIYPSSANAVQAGVRSFTFDGSSYSDTAVISTSKLGGQNVFFGYLPENSASFFQHAIGSAVQTLAAGSNGTSLQRTTASYFEATANNPSRQSVMTMGLWWSRELSASERGSMQDNPWQIFRPARTRLYSVPSVNNATTINVSSAELTGVTWPWTPTVRITSQ
jgi:hypothetical protein